MSSQSRVPAGIRTGGQFATSERAESDVNLGVGDPFKHRMVGGMTTKEVACGAAVDLDAEKPNWTSDVSRVTCPQCLAWQGFDEGVDADLAADLAAEYAAETAAHLAAEAALEAADREPNNKARWGDVKVGEGSRTPWGPADWVERPAAGIVSVSTPGHGGIKLSPERNAEIPPALRNKSGWYEEDCESNIVGMYHPEAFPHYKDGDHAAIREACEASVKGWFPDQYTKATGREVAVEESSVLRDRAQQADKEAFRAAHSHEFVTLGNGDTHAAWIPDGYAACKARLDDTGEERTFLMPRSEVIHNKSYGVNALVDPTRHLDVTDVVNAQPTERFPHHRPQVTPIKGEALGVNYSALTETQASRARAELEKRWRFHDDDGTVHVESLAEHFGRLGVVGKYPHYQDGKGSYTVAFEGSRVMSVSKAAYDALTGVPDTSTDTDRARIAWLRAETAHQKARASRGFSETPAQREKREKADVAQRQAHATYTALSDRDSAAARAWQDERDRMQAEVFARIAAERGVTFD